MFKITHPSVVIFINKIKSLKKAVVKTSYVLLIYLFTFFSTYAQEVPFSVDFQNTFKGNIVYLSNNVTSPQQTITILPTLLTAILEVPVN